MESTGLFRFIADGVRFHRSRMFRVHLQNASVRHSGHHSYVSVSAIDSGSASFDDSQGMVEGSPSTIHVENSFTSYHISIGTQPVSARILVFDESYVQEMMDHAGLMNPGEDVVFPSAIDMVSTEGHRFVRTLEFFRDWHSGFPNEYIGEMALASADRLLFTSLLELASSSGAGPPVALRSPVPREIRQAQKYILSGLAHPLNLDQIAENSGISRRSLCRGFRNSLGITVMDFVRNQRLKLAHRMLSVRSGQDSTVSSIALSSGFSNVSRFSHAYRQIYGCSPVQTLRESRTEFDFDVT